MTQKGKTLENYINYIADICNANFGHAHKNTTLRTLKGAPVKNHGEPFDFEFFGHSCVHCFDTKEYSMKKNSYNIYKFRHDTPERRQFTHLLNIHNLNPNYYKCYFLVWFRHLMLHSNRHSQCIFAFHITKIQNALDSNINQLSISDAEEFDAYALLADCCNFKANSIIKDICDFDTSFSEDKFLP